MLNRLRFIAVDNHPMTLNYSELDYDDAHYYSAMNESIADAQQSTESNSESESSSAPSATVQLRRSGRERRAPTRLHQPVNLYDYYDEDSKELVGNVTEIKQGADPVTVEEALSSDRANECEWQQAMDAEMNQLFRNDTWSVCELPADRKAIDNKWVFETKYNSDGSVEREKARLVAKGQRFLSNRVCRLQRYLCSSDEI